jgi:hypothetical protein
MPYRAIIVFRPNLPRTALFLVPAEVLANHSNSGVMTFLINQDGLLLQEDLGKTTTETAAAISEFDPDTSWSRVQE